MLIEGHLYFFTPFYFKDGNGFKDKYFIVLKNVGSECIIATLPTSDNKAPTLINIAHGCINHNDRLFNCYVFETQRTICENGFSFPLNTYVYGDKINDYEMKLLTQKGTIKLGQDYEVKGKLMSAEFSALIQCLKNSDATRSKYKRKL